MLSNDEKIDQFIKAFDELMDEQDVATLMRAKTVLESLIEIKIMKRKILDIGLSPEQNSQNTKKERKERND